MYIDTANILAELEARFPDGALGGGAEARAWAGWSDRVFPAAAGCIPAAMLKNEHFLRDRSDLTGTVSGRRRRVRGPADFWGSPGVWTGS